jgi:hypothetical protein
VEETAKVAISPRAARSDLGHSLRRG